MKKKSLDDLSQHVFTFMKGNEEEEIRKEREKRSRTKLVNRSLVLLDSLFFCYSSDGATKVYLGKLRHR